VQCRMAPDATDIHQEQRMKSIRNSGAEATRRPGATAGDFMHRGGKALSHRIAAAARRSPSVPGAMPLPTGRRPRPEPSFAHRSLPARRRPCLRASPHRLPLPRAELSLTQPSPRATDAIVHTALAASRWSE
jgi:hypothetical protein